MASDFLLNGAFLVGGLGGSPVDGFAERAGRAPASATTRRRRVTRGPLKGGWPDAFTLTTSRFVKAFLGTRRSLRRTSDSTAWTW
ncbi:MAG: hypothetical protein M0035_04105 [Actinomycetota bacterium]|nr:hypothetical protein [Actinomycetota bacterium]